MIKLLSFDLQGTISSSESSTHFWTELLPEFYSSKFNVSLEQAKVCLKDSFIEMGKYDSRYYDDKYWANLLDFDTKCVLSSLEKPKLNIKLLNYIRSSTIPCVILSTTTRTFIDFELGENKKYFIKTFSCIDDFFIAGKTKQAFQKMAREMNVLPEEILHIGDDNEMDYKNAIEAGCKAINFENEKSINEIKRVLNIS